MSFEGFRHRSDAGGLDWKDAMATKNQKSAETKLNSYKTGPDDKGFFGLFGGRFVAETLIGLLRADPGSYLSAFPRFRPFLGSDMKMGPTPNTQVTGATGYTRANFLFYARVAEPGVYR